MPEIEPFRSEQNEPIYRTVAERLDAAKTAEEFGEGVLDLIRNLERSMDDFFNYVDDISSSP